MLQLVFAAAALSPVEALAEIIDQRNDHLPITQVWNTPIIPDLQQSFTPSLTAIDFVEFIFENQTSTAGLLEVSLRNGINGHTIARSGISLAPAHTTGFVRFGFNRVPLIPNNVYAFNLHFRGGGASWAGGRLEDTYPSGVGYYSPGPNRNFDLTFREGIIPEPSLAGGAAITLWSVFSLRSGKAGRIA